MKHTRRELLGLLATLPVLEAFRPRVARAQSAAPLRFVGIFAPNGVVPSLWKPATYGRDVALPLSLRPLAPVLAHTSILSNTRLGPTDGMNSHGGGQTCFLTASDTFVGATSLDQAIGQLTEAQVRLPTLNLSIENNGYYWPSQIVPDSAGIYTAPNGEDRQDRCQDSESCRVSVSSGTTQANFYHPQVVFERLFGAASGGGGASGPSAAALKEAARRRRVVDLLKGHAAALRPRVSSQDQLRIEEYLSGVRQIERELDALTAPVSSSPAASCDRSTPVTGIPVDRDRYVHLLCELIARGFQCDATRSVTLMLGQGVSPMNFTVGGVAYSHHGDASHHGHDPARREAKGTIDAWQVGVYAHLVQRLADTADADGTPLIDRSAVFYGSDIADSEAHNAVDMPVLLGGRLGGALNPGGHVDGKNQTAGDLFVRIHQAFGATSNTFGRFGTRPMEGV